MQGVLHRLDLRFDVFPGKLDGDERMGLARRPLGLQIRLGVAIKADGVRRVTRLRPPVADGAVAAQVETKLDAVAVKTPAPIERFHGAELMIFNADALARKGAIKLSPALFHLRPRAAFISNGHKSLIVSLWHWAGKSNAGWELYS